MPGVQVVLHGFYIDQYPYPNEPGAIQTTNITRKEATKKCEEQDKRLCAELEWERACKGNQSTVYEYGDVYRRDDCGVGTGGQLMPTGTRVACRSEFNVHDMHGGAFEWTSSSWGRGTQDNRFAVRGGSGVPGEVIGRCANAIARSDRSYPDVGFRCCAGPPNDARVELEIKHASNPYKRISRDPELWHALASALPEQLADRIPPKGRGAFKVTRVGRWAPIGNEQLLVASGCAHPGHHAICGAIISRKRGDKIKPVAFAPSGWWLPNVQLDDDPRMIWVFGGDGVSKYRRKVAYLWGSVGVGEIERGGATRRPKRKRR
jgi:hypothetical protein